MLLKKKKRCLRHKRIRSIIKGTTITPRFSVFRSNKHIWCQLIDDQKGQTLIAANDKELKAEAKSQSKTKIKKEKSGESKKVLTGKIAVAFQVGRLIAKKAQEKGIQKVVFDRGGYKYHGRVRAAAEGAREEGLKF